MKEVELSSINKLVLITLLLIFAGFNAESQKSKIDDQFTELNNSGKVEVAYEDTLSIKYIDAKTIRATWYGPGFHGNLTSSGEVFDQEAFTAAHRTLPFGTMVRVTNLKNDKSVIVKINDRGPGSLYLDLDLSKGAARELDMLLAGVAELKMEIVQFSGVLNPIVSAD